MTTSEEQMIELNRQVESLQKTFIYDVNSKKELLDFIVETRAHQFAITNIVCSILAKSNETSFSVERHRYDVFMKTKLVQLLKEWEEKYAHLPGTT
jgi:hypothetical protein